MNWLSNCYALKENLKQTNKGWFEAVLCEKIDLSNAISLLSTDKVVDEERFLSDKTVPSLLRLSTGARKSCYHAQKEIPNSVKLNSRPLKKLGNFYDQLRYLLPNQPCRPFF